MIEEWRDIRGYEGMYQISNFGNFRSISRMIKAGHGSRPIVGKRLIPSRNVAGYHYANLFKDGKQLRIGIHQLVMREFVGDVPSGMEVNHKDGDKSNNRLTNLEYLTHVENMLHKANVLGKHERGELNAKAKLTEWAVKKIRQMRQARSHTQKEIAIMFGVSRATVQRIEKKTRWGWLE